MATVARINVTPVKGLALQHPDEVELTEHQAYLTGPAVLVAHGELALPERALLETQTRPVVSGSFARSSI